MGKTSNADRGTDSQQRRVIRRLRERAFTLVNKLQEFQDLESEAMPGYGISGLEGLKQSLMQFYSEGQERSG